MTNWTEEQRQITISDAPKLLMQSSLFISTESRLCIACNIFKRGFLFVKVHLFEDFSADLLSSDDDVRPPNDRLDFLHGAVDHGALCAGKC